MARYRQGVPPETRTTFSRAAECSAVSIPTSFPSLRCFYSSLERERQVNKIRNMQNHLFCKIIFIEFYQVEKMFVLLTAKGKSGRREEEYQPELTAWKQQQN